MHKTTRKQLIGKIVFTILLVLIIISLSFSLVHRIRYLKSGISSYEITNFKKYKDSFDIIADTLRLHYCKEDEKYNISHMIVESMTAEQWIISCVVDSEQYQLIIKPSVEEIHALQEVQTAFNSSHDGGLYFIKVMKNQITFASSFAPYAIIYVDNSHVPDFILSPDELHEHIFFEKLSYKWYQGITDIN